MASEQLSREIVDKPSKINAKNSQFLIEGKMRNARIRKRLSFLILTLIILIILGFFLYTLPRGTVGMMMHSDQVSLHFVAKEGEQLEKQVKIINDAQEKVDVEMLVENVQNLVKADVQSFTLGPKQSKTVNFVFSSFGNRTGDDMDPGIYVGKVVVKSELGNLEVPVVVEIETSSVLVDLVAEPVYSSNKLGANNEIKNEGGIAKITSEDSLIWATLKMFSLGSQESAKVENFYYIMDMGGNVMQMESETMDFESQALFLKNIATSDMPAGTYVYGSHANFQNSVGTSSFIFEILDEESGANSMSSCKDSILCIGPSILSLILAFALLVYFYFFIGSLSYEDASKGETMLEEGEEKIPGEKISERIPAAEATGMGQGRLAQEITYKRFALLVQTSNKYISYGRIHEAKRLYTEAREVYIGLNYKDKTRAYSMLADLYSKLAK